MMRSVFHIFVVASVFLVSCKARPGAKSAVASQNRPGADAAVTSQNRPDKVSEEPVGLPGYPLVCDWVQPPTQDTLDAKLDCYLQDENGKAAPITKDAIWTITPPKGIEVTQTKTAENTVAINFKGQTRDEIAAGIRTTDFKAELRSKQVESSGTQLIRAPTSKLRLAASCNSLFSFLLGDDVAAFSWIQFNRFEGCNVFAAKLVNLVVPSPQLKALPNLSKTVSASCTDRILTIAVNQPGFQGGGSQGPFEQEACEDIARYINSLGL